MVLDDQRERDNPTDGALEEAEDMEVVWVALSGEALLGKHFQV